jgi:2-amino-4-hydroxy-6-hydroxymethyldihydropteridine diphosphokinase
MNEKIYILLGSNKGERLDYLKKSHHEIARICGAIISKSSIYITEAWGNTKQASFLNQVIEIESVLTPEALLSNLLAIEARLGRKREEKWGPREIDLDILFYGSQVIHLEHLKIPHPEIQNRRFTLQPLVELASDFIHPTIGASLGQLLKICDDTLDVKKFL